jgi:hypothetical protein
MNPNQSTINQIRARISQIENSELFTQEEKERLIKKQEEALDLLLNKSANEIQVNNPEILS